MKALVFSVLLMVFGAQFAQADSVADCNQEGSSEVRIIRELR